MEQYFEIISEAPLFSGISCEDLQSLMGCLQARVIAVQKGEPVFLEGDAAGFVGIVLEGSIQLERYDYYGDRSVIGWAESGDIFGETFACAGIKTMPVSAYAQQNSRVMMLSFGKMLTVCSNACPFHNKLVKNMMRLVAKKNLELSGKIRIMSRKTTREKLMEYLLEQAKRADSSEFTIPFDRQALADYLGVERSAMSAELGKLKNAGILETKGSHFRLL